MKPRNKREREVAELSSKLPPLIKQEEWAKEHIFSNEAYKCKSEMWCSHCANTWVNVDNSELAISLKIGTDKVECPHCHHKLTVKVSRKQKNESVNYMTIVSVCGEYQVLRHVYCYKLTRKKESSVHLFFSEVVQEWISIDGKRTIMAKPMNMGSSGWIYSDLMSIKNEYGSSYYNYGDTYALYGEVYTKIELLPIFRKYGLKNCFHGVLPSKLIRNLLKGGDYELCLKTKQYSMLQYLHKAGCANISYKHSFNICNRNGYKIKDASMWVDYIELLSYFNLDLRNSKYVCPKNLKVEHDKLMNKKQKIENRLREQRQREQVSKTAISRREAICNFYKMKTKFFGLTITDGNITISPLESVTQFYQEAKLMHHCVFSNHYYKKPEALIMSAKIGQERLETIEVNLKTLEIIQSRAVRNKESEYHQQIISLLKKNMNLIRQRLAA